MGRAHENVGCHGEHDRTKPDNRRADGPGRGALGLSSLLRFGCGQQPAGNFGLCGLGVGLGDHPAGYVLLNFGKLVFVDVHFRRVFARRVGHPAQQGPKHKQNDDNCRPGNCSPENHKRYVVSIRDQVQFTRTLSEA